MTDPGAVPDTLTALLRSSAAAAPDDVALVVDGAVLLTAGEWVARADSVAVGLLERGVAAGDRVAIRFAEGGWIGYAVAAAAVHLVGGVVVGLPAALPAAEVSARLRQCGVIGTVLGDNVPGPVRPGWTVRAADLERGARQPPAVPVHPEDLAEILYTSGTTGAAKPVAVSHASLTHGRNARGRLVGGVGSVLCPVPIGTNAAHSALMIALSSRSTVHVLSRIEAADIAVAVERSRIEMTVLPPHALRRWTAAGTARHDLCSLTDVMLGSALVPVAAARRLSRMLPDARIVVGYGSTESAPAYLQAALPPGRDLGPEDGSGEVGCLSFGSAGGGAEVQVVDQDGAPLLPGEVGEICLRAPGPRRYYYGDPVATSAVFLPDGWTRMGDLGRLEPDGTLQLFDRARHVVRTARGPVSSSSIEDVLQWYPRVVESAVFGLPGPDGDQVVAAVVVSEPTEPDELLDFLASRSSPPPVPVRILIVDDLPRGPLGKVLKQRLRERFAQVGLPA